MCALVVDRDRTVAGDPLELTRAGAWNDRTVDFGSVSGKHAAMLEYERALFTVEAPADAIEREIDRRPILGRRGEQLGSRLAFEIARKDHKYVEVTYDLDAKRFGDVQRIVHIVFDVQG